MNVTNDVISIMSVCNNCQTSNGFSSADRRSIILMVVLTSIIVVACYVGVLWFAIRTRFISEKIIVDVVHKNEAFNNEEEQDEEYIQPIDNTTTATTTTAAAPYIDFSIVNESARS